MKTVSKILCAVALASVIAMIAFAQNAPPAGSATPQNGAASQSYGIAAKRPVLGGACAFCPWGALADIVKAAMRPLGYDVQVCYNCSAVNASREVAGAQIPPQRSPLQISLGSPPPPNAPVDFGVTSPDQLSESYSGTGAYAPDGPHKNLRLFALIDQPSYLIVAVKQSSGITDLAQVRDKKMPVRIYTSGAAGDAILQYYGLTREALGSWGGSINGQTGEQPAGGRGGRQGNAAAQQPALPPNPGGRTTQVRDFDVYIQTNSVLANNPESNIWYQVSQIIPLNYLQMPEDLLQKMAKDLNMERVDLPQGYLAGVERRIPTVGRNGQVIYGRADAPDDFAYAVAKAMDKDKGLLKWAVLPFSYDPDTVWKSGDVPLHPGAARYYKEMGYMK